jgi:hypothetical protein
MRIRIQNTAPVPLIGRVNDTAVTGQEAGSKKLRASDHFFKSMPLNQFCYVDVKFIYVHCYNAM